MDEVQKKIMRGKSAQINSCTASSPGKKFLQGPSKPVFREKIRARDFTVGNLEKKNIHTARKFPILEHILLEMETQPVIVAPGQVYPLD